MIDKNILAASIEQNVRNALIEDVGFGDITANIIPENEIARARVISREAAIVCGTGWVDETFLQVDSRIQVNWQIKDGDKVDSEDCLFELSGPARGLLTGERTALNFLQLLSGTATRCKRYADMVADTGVKLLDTRKTIPGLRIAQKYAVTMGGCFNHRIGLYDAFLIKENHIAASGSIRSAVENARQLAPDKPVEVEVENLIDLEQALSVGADIVMLDNFNIAAMKQAVDINAGRAKLEASGGITDETLRPIAETGVDYISIGALTKDCQSIDLSMRFEPRAN